MQLISTVTAKKWNSAFKDGWRMFWIFIILLAYSNMLWYYKHGNDFNLENLISTTNYAVIFGTIYSFWILVPFFIIEAFFSRILFQNIFNNKAYPYVYLFILALSISTFEGFLYIILDNLINEAKLRLISIPKELYNQFIKEWVMYSSWTLRIIVFNIIRYYYKLFNW